MAKSPQKKTAPIGAFGAPAPAEELQRTRRRVGRPSAAEAAEAKPATEEATKMLATRLTKSQWRQVSELAIDVDMTKQDLTMQALNELFKAQGRPALDPELDARVGPSLR